MGFFEPPPPSPPQARRREEPQRPRMPAWYMPPEEVLAGVAPLDGFVRAYFRMSAREFRQSTPKQLAGHIVDDDKPFGLLALQDGTPLGWVAVSPRLDNPRLQQSMVARVDPTTDLTCTWSITCFYTGRSARRRGLSSRLLSEAVRLETLVTASRVCLLERHSLRRCTAP